MVKDTSTSSGLPREKRQTSLSNFISKLLPSHRAEQGGTARDRHAANDSESAYRDLGMNPNDLTEWSLPQDPPLRPPLPQEEARGRHPVDHDRATHRGRSPQRDTTGQSSRIPRKKSRSAFPWSPASLGEHPALKGSSGAQTLPRKILPGTTNEIHDALKTKEAIRRNRRSLKESGDWLGVQGADPRSGEFAVLTPTSTLSSDATSPSAKLRLEQLSERQKGAIAAYETAKLEEQEETERIMLQKGRSKLEKLEHAKEERRQLQQERFPTWSKHRRRWSSVAEPGLSPIPQSLKSIKINGSSEESIPLAPVRNFSRPSKPVGGPAFNEPRVVEVPAASENIDSSKHSRRKDQSTETVIHQTLPSMKIRDISLKPPKMFHPPVLSETSESLLDEQKKEKHFLWKRHRRMSDPGKTQKRSKALMIHSSAKTEENLAFTSVEALPPLPRIGPQKPRDHFPDLPIPDHRLSPLPFTEQSMMTERSLMRTEEGPSPEIPGITLQVQNSSTLRVATNRSDPPEIVLDTKEATVILSQSKLRGNTMPPSTVQRVIPLRSSSFQAGATPAQGSKIPIRTPNQMRNRSDGTLPRNMAEPQTVDDQSKVQETSKAETLEDHISIDVSGCREEDQGGSVSTPTIIITGFDHHHHHQSEDTQSQVEHRGNRKSHTVSDEKAPTAPNSHNGEPVSQAKQGQTPPSHPTMPQNDSQNSVPARKTLEADTVSPGPVMGGTNSTTTAQNRGQSGPSRIPRTMLMKRTAEELGEYRTTHRQQHHDSIEEQNTPIDFETDTTNPTHHGQSNNTVQVAAHRSQEPGELNEAMIQEAARIAMRRSRAREVVTTRSPSRTPSPRVATETRTATTAATTAVQNRHNSRSPLQQQRDGEEIGVGIDDIHAPSSGSRAHCDADLHHHRPQQRPLSDEGQPRGKTEKEKESVESAKETKTKDGERKKTTTERDTDRDNASGKSGTNTGGGAMVVFISLVIVCYLVVLGLASAWWVVVRPAFDQRSDLWKRKRRRETTGEDVGVFVAAVLFCLGGAFVVGTAMRSLVWIASL